jgi:hypothetical protein
MSFTSSSSMTSSGSPSQTASGSPSQTSSGSPSQSNMILQAASAPVGVKSEAVVYISIIIVPFVLALLYFLIRKLQRRICNLNSTI